MFSAFRRFHFHLYTVTHLTCVCSLYCTRWNEKTPFCCLFLFIFVYACYGEMHVMLKACYFTICYQSCLSCHLSGRQDSPQPSAIPSSFCICVCVCVLVLPTESQCITVCHQGNFTGYYICNYGDINVSCDFNWVLAKLLDLSEVQLFPCFKNANQSFSCSLCPCLQVIWGV